MIDCRHRQPVAGRKGPVAGTDDRPPAQVIGCAFSRPNAPGLVCWAEEMRAARLAVTRECSPRLCFMQRCKPWVFVPGARTTPGRRRAGQDIRRSVSPQGAWPAVLPPAGCPASRCITRFVDCLQAAPDHLRVWPAVLPAAGCPASRGITRIVDCRQAAPDHLRVWRAVLPVAAVRQAVRSHALSTACGPHRTICVFCVHRPASALKFLLRLRRPRAARPAGIVARRRRDSRRTHGTTA